MTISSMAVAQGEEQKELVSEDSKPQAPTTYGLDCFRVKESPALLQLCTLSPAYLLVRVTCARDGAQVLYRRKVYFFDPRGINCNFL